MYVIHELYEDFGKKSKRRVKFLINIILAVRMIKFAIII